MENSSEYYYNQLAKDDQPGKILAAFYCTLYDIEITRSEIMMCNKLVKVFGRFIVFSAILSAAKSNPKPLENPYPYIFEICRARFETTHLDSSIQARERLDRYIENIDEEIERMKNSKSKVKIPSSEGLE